MHQEGGDSALYDAHDVGEIFVPQNRLPPNRDPVKLNKR